MNLNEMMGAVIAFVVIVILISIGADVVSEIQETQTGNQTAYNVSAKGLEGMKTFGDWLPTIATVIAAAVIIGLIIGYFMLKVGGR